MSNIEVPWQVDGVMTPEQSVTSMLPVIESRGIQHSGTFWTWEGKVRPLGLLFNKSYIDMQYRSPTRGEPSFDSTFRITRSGLLTSSHGLYTGELGRQFASNVIGHFLTLGTGRAVAWPAVA